MNWEALGALAELAGAIGVILSLLYLATQIRQNTKTVRAAAVDSAADRATEGIRAVALNGELAEILGEGHKDYASLEGTRQHRYRAFEFVHFRQYESIFLRCREGLIPQSHWEGFRESLHFANRRPGVRQCWRELRLIYSPEFRVLVDESVETLSREQGDDQETASLGDREAQMSEITA